MPDSVSEERRKLVAHYGAEVILIHDAGNIGDCIEECLATALRMAAEDPRVFVPQQFENPANPMAHRHHTGLEILEQVAGPSTGSAPAPHRRHHHRHRRSAEGPEPGHRNLGGGAGKRCYFSRRHGRHPPSDGHWGRGDSRHPQPADLRPSPISSPTEEAIRTSKDLARRKG